MANLNQYFGFSARQLRALWWTLALGVISTIYLVVREFSSDVSSADGITIYVGGKDRTFSPMVIVDLNNSPRDSLELVPGIGPVFAERIVAYRDSSAGFLTKEDLMKIRGIGGKSFLRIEPYITVGK